MCVRVYLYIYLCTCAYYNHVIFLYNESVQNNQLTAAMGVKKQKEVDLWVFLPLSLTYSALAVFYNYLGLWTPFTDLLKIRECKR